MGLFTRNGDFDQAKELKGKSVVLWEPSVSDKSIIWTIPEVKESKKKDKDRESWIEIKKIDYFAVRDTERTILLMNGVLQDVVSGGVYELAKEAKNEATQLIFVNTGEIEIPWGIPKQSGVQTSDGVPIGFSGTLIVQVIDPKAFYLNMVGKQRTFDPVMLGSKLRNTLIAVMREIIPDYEVAQLVQVVRDEFHSMVEATAATDLNRWGIALRSIEMKNYNIPPEYQDLVSQKADIAVEEVRSAKEIEMARIKKTTEDQVSQYQPSSVAISGLTEGELVARMAEIEEKITKLDEMLLDDKITEEKHTEMMKRFNEELRLIKQHLNIRMKKKNV